MKKLVKRGAIILFMLGFVPVIVETLFHAQSDGRFSNIHAPLFSIVGCFLAAAFFLVFCAMVDNKRARLICFIILFGAVATWNFMMYGYLLGS